MPMSPEKKKFYTFRNWSIYQVNGMIKMLETMQSKARELDRADTEDIASDISYTLEHLHDLAEELQNLSKD